MTKGKTPKQQPAVKPESEPEEPLGVAMGLCPCGCNSICMLPIRPVTKEEATTYFLATLQSHQFGRHYQPDTYKAPKPYWIPLAAFEPILRTDSPLTAEALRPSPEHYDNFFGRLFGFRLDTDDDDT